MGEFGWRAASETSVSWVAVRSNSMFSAIPRVTGRAARPCPAATAGPILIFSVGLPETVTGRSKRASTRIHSPTAQVASRTGVEWVVTPFNRGFTRSRCSSL